MKRKSLAAIDLEPGANTEATESKPIPSHPSTSLGMLGAQPDDNRPRKEFVFQVNAKSCVPWAFHNRKAASWWNYDSCKDVIESIRNRGQDTPAVARRRKESEVTDGIVWEIIAGRRRWYACDFLGIPLKLKEFEGTDREAAIVMNSENMDRDDITEFEYALSFKEQLQQGLFSSQDDMLLALTSSEEGHLKLNKSKLSKMLKAAELYKYPALERIFPDAAVLKVNPVYGLMVELDTHKETIIKRANTLSAKFESRALPKPSLLIKDLIDSISRTTKGDVQIKKATYKGKSGNLLFEVTRTKAGMNVVLPKQSLVKASKDREELIKAFEKMLLEHAT